MYLKRFFPLLKLGEEITVLDISAVFEQLRYLGVNKIIVTPDEMSHIVRWYIANVGSDKNGNQGKILTEGKLTKLAGVDIHYEGEI